jgi:hypothetical protein
VSSTRSETRCTGRAGGWTRSRMPPWRASGARRSDQGRGPVSRVSGRGGRGRAAELTGTAHGLAASVDIELGVDVPRVGGAQGQSVALIVRLSGSGGGPAPCAAVA